MDAVKPPQVEPSLKEIEFSVKEGDLLKRYLHLHSKLQLVVWIIIESGLICELGLLGYLCYASFTPEVTSQDHFDVIGSTFQVPQGWEACIIIQMIFLAINAIVIGLVARGIRNQRLDSKELQTSSNNSNRFVDRFNAQMAKYKFSGEVVEPKEDPNKNVQQEEQLTPTFQKMYTQIYLTGAISQFFSCSENFLHSWRGQFILLYCWPSRLSHRCLYCKIFDCFGWSNCKSLFKKEK